MSGTAAADVEGSPSPCVTKAFGGVAEPTNSSPSPGGNPEDQTDMRNSESERPSEKRYSSHSPAIGEVARAMRIERASPDCHCARRAAAPSASQGMQTHARSADVEPN